MVKKFLVGSAACLTILGAVATPLPASADDVLTEGIKLYDQGSYEAAKVYFRQATTDPNAAAQARYCLATTLYKLGELEEAKTEYRRCIAMWVSPDLKRNCDAAIAMIEKKQVEDRENTSVAEKPKETSKDNKDQEPAKPPEAASKEVIDPQTKLKIVVQPENPDLKIWDLSDLIKKQYEEQKAERAAAMAAYESKSKESQ